MVLKGVGQIAKKSEEVQKEAQKDRIQYVKIADKESAMLRFLTDSDEIISAQFHNYVEKGTDGKEYTRSKYCSDTSECDKCAEGNPTREVLFLWAWEYYIMHQAQNPALDNDPTAIKWERVVPTNGKPYYKEIVNEPRVFRTGVGSKNKYKGALIGFATDYGTFTDRDYRYSRTGAGKNDTSYEIIPQNPKPMDEKIKSIISSLPELSKVVTGEIYAFNQAPKEESSSITVPAVKKPEVKKSAVTVTEEEIAESDLENLF